MSLAVSMKSRLGAHVLLCLRSSRAQPHLVLCCAVCPAVDQEQSFQDKYLFYRFLEDEREDAPPPSEEERKQSQEELQDTLLLLSQIGPDAHMRMILRKQYESDAKVPKTRTMARMIELIHFKMSVFSSFLCSPSERTAEDLEIIYEELLHIKALAHLSTTVSRGGHLPASFSGIKTVIRASFRGNQLDKPDTTAKNSICSANSSVNLNKNKFCKNEVNLSEYLVKDANCNFLGNL